VTIFILKRMGQGVFLIWLMSLVAFLAIFALGNPITALINPNSPPDVVAQVSRELGLDLPFHQQYWRFVTHLLRGDLGQSYITSQPALGLILERFPATLELTFVAMTIAAAIGIPLGVLAGYKPRSAAGRLANGFSMVLLSLPSFWTALALLIVFSIEARILPTGGRGQTGTFLGVTTSLVTWDGWRHVLLPAVNLSIYPLALFIRLIASGVQETMHASFIRFAQAKGLTTRRILFVYVLSNVLVPVITVVGIVFGVLLAFAVVTETIFAWPGSGRLIIDSIRSSDRPVVIAYLLFTVTIFIVINFAVDIACALIDPRISLESGKS
jgi:peptide/nickel transport system permease protein